MRRALVTERPPVRALESQTAPGSLPSDDTLESSERTKATGPESDNHRADARRLERAH